MPADMIVRDASAVRTLPELARLLRQLRRREARRRESSALTYRELAAKTGWSHAIIGEYLAGTALPPTDRFDALVQILGATMGELGPLATARDRVEENRRPIRPGPRAPRQLPAPVPGFVGREAALAELDRWAGRAGLVIAAICGTGGVGKTALALEWAHRATGRFPDGHLHVDLHGYAAADPLDPAEALSRFLYALGVEPATIPSGTPDRAALFRTLLAGRRMLLVLDNASSAEQVRPLLPGSPLCMVVVTSRDSLAGLVAAEGAYRVDLDVLSEPEALVLLRMLLGERVGAAPDAARALARQCGRLPLALRVAAELAASRADAPLPHLVAELRSQRLDMLDGGDDRSAVRSVLSWSYRKLSPAAARLFRLFGCDPGPSLSLPAVASLAGVPVESAKRLLAELTRAHMVNEDQGRFAMHDVLRAYASELTAGRDTERDRRAAVGRLLDHYVHTAVQADRRLDPTRVPVDVDGVTPNVTVPPIDSVAAAQAWFTAEHETLTAAVRAAHGFPEHAWQLPWAMANFLDRNGFWTEWAALNELALDRVTESAALAQAHRGKARAETRLRNFSCATSHYGYATIHFGRCNDDAGRAAVQVNLSEMQLAAGRIPEALHHQRQALELFRSLGHPVGQAKSLNNLGYLHAIEGAYAEALAECAESVELWQRLGDRGAAAPALDSLGYAHHRLGQFDQAVAYYQEALARHQEAGHRLYQASVWTHLGDVHRDAGRPADAGSAWQAARAILDDLGQGSTARPHRND